MPYNVLHKVVQERFQFRILPDEEEEYEGTNGTIQWYITVEVAKIERQEPNPILHKTSGLI